MSELPTSYSDTLSDGLTITASGPGATGGRISLTELSRIASGFQATLERLALSIVGGRSRAGRRPQEIASAVRLDFVGSSEGSTVLELFPASDAQMLDDVLADSYQTLIDGLRAISENPNVAPVHFTPQVINGLVTLCGGMSRRNITSIGFGSGKTEHFLITQGTRRNLKEIQKRTLHEETTVVGRLHMGDFDPMALRCRIDTHTGSITCDFDDDLRDAVFALMDDLVMASGTAELQADHTTIRVLHLSELEQMATSTAPPLDELARQQGVDRVLSIDDLRGEPIEGFDEFLDIVRSARG